MKTLRCPSCGSDSVNIQEIEEKRQLTLGPEFSYKVPVNICGNCGEEWDAEENCDSIRENSLEEAKKELAGILIDDLQSKGLKLSYVERALELPQRTISSKWRTGISASGLALLRIVSSMPWIVPIADSKFNKVVIGKEIARVLVDNGVTYEAIAGGKDGIHITITKASGALGNQIGFGAEQMLITTATGT